MSNNAVIHSSSSPPLSQHVVTARSFQQGGVWSWSDLMGKSLSGAMTVMSRLSEGGVDPFTAAVGQFMCQEFKLGHEGKQLYISILNNLSCYSTLGQVIHFGFGVDSIVRNLSASYEGGILVILCAALGECYFDRHAADILCELVQAYKPENSGDRTPSPAQWLSLIRQCNGVLANDEFPVVAEHLMRLHPQNRLDVGKYLSEEHPKQRHVSSPESFAEALLAIGKLSTGKLESITITGAADAGWLAAVSQRFFNLRLAIFGPDGELLHKNFREDQRPQIKILYELASEEGTKKEVEVSGKLYCLRDATEFLLHRDGLYGASLLCGRVTWEAALSSTFGADFSRLMASPTAFGSVLGASARIFDAIANAKTGVNENTLIACTTYFAISKGQGLLSFATSRFPELSPLKSQMERVPKVSFQETCSIYETYMANIKQACKCQICQEGIGEEIREEAFCLVILAEVVIMLLRTLSGTSVPEKLRPVRAGIEWFYGQQINARRVYNSIQQEVIQYGPVAYILDVTPTGQDDSVTGMIAIRRLLHTTRIFAGRDVPATSFNRSALSVAGVCVYLDILTNVSCHAEDLGRCTIIPGKIEMAGRSYEYAEDLSDFELGGMEFRRRKSRDKAPYLVYSPSELISGYETTSITVQPAIDYLQVGILMKKASSGSILLGPSPLVRGVLTASGLVQCKHTGHNVSKRRLPTDEPARRVNLDGGHPIWEFQGSPFSKMVAYSQNLSLNYHVIWRHDECLACCVNAASSEQPTLIIV